MSPARPRDFVVRLGRLDCRDFGLLGPPAAARLLEDPDSVPLLGPALGSDPLTLHRLSRACPERAARILALADGEYPPAERDRCRDELARRWCVELLRHKAPPLYDALPWFDLDPAPLVGKLRPWRSRFLLCGAGAATMLLRFPRTAGVTLVEPDEPVARYAEERVRLERIRNASALRCPLDGLPGGSGPFDLTLAGLPLLAPAEAALERVCAASRTVVLLELGPDNQPPGPELLARLGFTPTAFRFADGSLGRGHVRHAA